MNGASGTCGRPEDRVIPVMTALSVLVHAAGIALAVWIAQREPPKITPVQKPVTAKLVRLGKPRDKRLLPRLEQEAPPPPPPPKTVDVPVPDAPAAPPPPVSVPSTAPTVPAAPQKTQTRAPTTRTSHRTALATAARRQSLFSAFSNTAKSAADEAVGEEDGDPEGDSDSAEEGERYFGLILAKARRHYDVSKSISPQEIIRLKAVVVLYIGSRGELIRDPELQKSSGNGLFDQEVLMALKKAAPFGPPPKNLAETLRTVGVAIEAKP